MSTTATETTVKVEANDGTANDAIGYLYSLTYDTTGTPITISNQSTGDFTVPYVGNNFSATVKSLTSNLVSATATYSV